MSNNDSLNQPAEIPKKRSLRFKLGIALAIVAIVITGSCLLCGWFVIKDYDENRFSQPKFDPENSRFTIPGPAFIDGSVSYTKPPFTAVAVGVLEYPNGDRLLCYVSHNAEIQIFDYAPVYYADDLQWYYFLVETEECRGWVIETVVSTEQHEPIGEQYCMDGIADYFICDTGLYAVE